MSFESANYMDPYTKFLWISNSKYVLNNSGTLSDRSTEVLKTKSKSPGLDITNHRPVRF
jgi:hypothetical protein